MKASDNQFPRILLIAADPSTADPTPAGTQSLVIDSTDGDALKRLDDAGTLHPIESSAGAAAFVGCKALRSTNQSLAASNTFYAVQFNDADEYDTDSIHDPATNNTRFTVPAGKGGVWRFTGTAVFASGTSTLRTAVWSKNGTQLNAIHGGERVVSTDAFLNATLSILLAAGDYVEFLVSAGVAINLAGASVAAEFKG